jgi:hypothetical protein
LRLDRYTNVYLCSYDCCHKRLNVIAQAGYKTEDAAPTHCALEKARGCWCSLISPRKHLDVLVLVVNVCQGHTRNLLRSRKRIWVMAAQLCERLRDAIVCCFLHLKRMTPDGSGQSLACQDVVASRGKVQKHLQVHLGGKGHAKLCVSYTYPHISAQRTR